MDESHFRAAPRRSGVFKWFAGGSARLLATFAALTVALPSGMATAQTAPAPADLCAGNTITARVVALDQVLMFNRLGAQNVNGMIYALRRDVVDIDSLQPEVQGASLAPGNVQLRPDKRPRPLTLRVSKGQCLQVEVTNLLAPIPNPNPNGAGHHPAPNLDPAMITDDQINERRIGFNPAGLELVNAISDSNSFVGANADSTLGVGETGTFTYFAREEGAFLVQNLAASFGGDASAGNEPQGLFGVVNVQPPGATYFRSQATEEEMALATTGTTADGQPIVDYTATYPHTSPWIEEGKAGLPVLSMLHGNELVHSDINAIIVGPEAGGRFNPSIYALESQGMVNPTVPNRLEPFREFTVVFHDEMVSAQVFPQWYKHPVLKHTLHGVRDSFMINYGSGGIGSEIIANRLGVGPMYDCLDCAYEEFFLSAYTVGDPAMVVDIPANFGLENCQPDGTGCTAVGPKATHAMYPDDPSNVHHSYISDAVRFRNLHAGKEQHVFHLHANQWVSDANDDNSTYLDSQGIGPGSGYTYETAFGGTGNRNKLPGDSIFHCHFYPHFAQGMWEMWRSHDVLETGTRLSVSGTGHHTTPWALQNGTPAPGARALPDGEILAGTPIPAVVPIPARPMAPTPGKVTVVQKDANGDGIGDSSQALVDNADLDMGINPGYPFYIAGIEDTVGQRPTTPPLDMDLATGGWDGGLPRHTLDGLRAGGVVGHEAHTRLDMTKDMAVARPVFYPEGGTKAEKVAMAFHQQRCVDTFLPDGTPALCDPVNEDGFVLNGNAPVPGAPYAEPCIDDRRQILRRGQEGLFFGATGTPTEPFVPQFGAFNPRLYKAANIELNVTLNKLGYHFPQQRIITLWEDVMPTLTNQRPPEPFAIRLNTADCATFLHTNLVPEYYEMDDYQVRTPTDIIGQHIHLVKFDVTASDGSGNGWNYEDGTLSPETVRQRIKAINAFNATNAPVATLDGRTHLDPLPHPFFGPLDQSTPDAEGHKEWDGARTTIQRWFADPVLNTKGEDRGLGIVFTHDHYGPSTHQQVGLYATVLVEPANSKWVHSETGAPLYDTATRSDGGPTSWQAVIIPQDAAGNPVDANGDGKLDTFREFYFEFSDFQHAYLKGVYVGRDEKHNRVCPEGQSVCPDPNTFRSAINPSFRQPAPFPDVQTFPANCPGGVPRPCPEAISADDVGMLVVNYRQEPVALRVFDPNAIGPDGKSGSQAAGLAGDLAFAMQSRTDRAIPQFNTALGDTPYPPLTADVLPGDPYTPLMRAQEGDEVRVKIQAGAHEHEHNGTIQGHKWLMTGGGFGKGSPNSGWRNSQNWGISEQAALTTPVGLGKNTLAEDNGTNTDPERTDYYYSVDASQDGWWSGMWGLLRTYQYLPADLYPASQNTQEMVRATQPPEPGKAFHPKRPVTLDLSAVDGITLADILVEKKIDDIFALEPEVDTTGWDADTLTRETIRVLKNGGLGNAGSPGYSNNLKAAFATTLGNGKALMKGASKNALKQQAALEEITGIALRYVGNLNLEVDPSLQDIDVRSGKFHNFAVSQQLSDALFDQILKALRASGDPEMEKAYGSWFSTIFSKTQQKNVDALKAAVDYLVRTNLNLGTTVFKSTGPDHFARQLHPACPADAPLRQYEVHAVQANAVMAANNTPGVTLVPAGPEATMHVGATPDPKGGTLVYNSRPTTLVELGGVQQKQGPLHDPTAIMYVLKDDLPLLKSGHLTRPKPITLRANAGECIAIDLQNDLPEVTLDLANYSLLLQVAIRDQNAVGGGVTGFQNNLIRPSSHVGLQPQLVHYMAQDGDAINVGQNPVQTVAPKDRRTLYWYAGDVSQQMVNGTLQLVYTPVEFGGANLTPADKVKQGQKGLIGGLVIHPQDSTWIDGVDAEGNADRTQVTVTGVNGTFRDMVTMSQKALAFRYADGTAAKTIAAEDNGAPADSHDTGHMGINYGTEPMWYRYGVLPETPFGRVGPNGKPGLATLQNVYRAYSNTQVGGDPQTPVFTAEAGQPFRMHMLLPTGIGRATTYGLYGHVWQRFPYLAGTVPSQTIGLNPYSRYEGTHESVSPMAHFDWVFPSAGGTFGVTGDYLFRDYGSFGNTSGLWGLVRVQPPLAP
ncbi:MAG: hypothetical protein OEY97_12105 [Nitrospirota bacterium]|nr:hypothetical protein [Nitrospirota bacterium]